MTALHRAGMFFGLLDELASDDRVTDIAVLVRAASGADVAAVCGSYLASAIPIAASGA